MLQEGRQLRSAHLGEGRLANGLLALTPPPSTDTTFDGDLLAEPQSDAESLLGLEVLRSEDGAWTLARERRPGCQVAAERHTSEYTGRREVRTDTIASLAAGESENGAQLAAEKTRALSTTPADRWARALIG